MGKKGGPALRAGSTDVYARDSPWEGHPGTNTEIRAECVGKNSCVQIGPVGKRLAAPCCWVETYSARTKMYNAKNILSFSEFVALIAVEE